MFRLAFPGKKSNARCAETILFRLKKCQCAILLFLFISVKMHFSHPLIFEILILNEYYDAIKVVFGSMVWWIEIKNLRSRLNSELDTSKKRVHIGFHLFHDFPWSYSYIFLRHMGHMGKKIWRAIKWNKKAPCAHI